MQPLNMIKNYYGEKYAFEYAYLVHYQAWLFIPAVVGLFVVYGSVQIYADKGEMKEALDTWENGIFGLFVSIWATCFLESWKRKQRTIQFLWNCSDNSYSRQGERTEEFLSYDVFNHYTNHIETIKKKPD